MSRLFFRAVGTGLILVLSCVLPLFAQEGIQTEVYGGGGGSSFSETMLQSAGRIAEIHVFSGDWVDAIQIIYALPDGKTVSGRRFGGNNGKEGIFRLDADEYITSISGRYGDYIDSVVFQTNRRSSARFGGSGGRQDYRVNVPAGFQAAGITGRSARYLDAIGLVAIQAVTRQETQTYGGRGGAPFTDRDVPNGAQITEIRINSADVVDGIQLVYSLRDGRVIEGPHRGGSGGRLDVFRLDADEYITGIYGRYGDFIDSLVIVTNRRSSQSFGGRGGRADFRINIPSGMRAIGFSGRSAKYLDAIGLAYEQETNRSQRRDSIRRLPGRNRP
jgi:hypothetical protein